MLRNLFSKKHVLALVYGGLFLLCVDALVWLTGADRTAAVAGFALGAAAALAADLHTWR